MGRIKDSNSVKDKGKRQILSAVLHMDRCRQVLILCQDHQDRKDNKDKEDNKDNEVSKVFKVSREEMAETAMIICRGLDHRVNVWPIRN